MGKIDIDLSKAIGQAKELERISNKLSQIAKQNMSDSISNIYRNWEGDNGAEFCRKGHVIVEDIDELATKLNSVAAKIKVVAKRTYDAEKKIQDIAMKRTYE